MKSILITATIILISISASAGTFYRCQVDGRTIISNAPCVGQRIETGNIQIAPTIPESQPKPPTTQRRSPTLYQQTAPAARRTPTVKKYDINHSVAERNGKVEVSGRITGPRCNSLRVSVWARTSEGGIIGCVDVTSLSGISTTFSCSDTTWRRGSRDDWFISTIEAKCQD